MKLVSDPGDWQPFTFRGVATLATGPPRRLIKVQLLAGAWVIGSLTWFLATAWWPVIDAAGEHLPNQAAIRGRTLEWEGPLPVRLAENTFLSVTVNLEGGGARASVSDLQLELVREGIRLHSFFGHLLIPYPPGYVVRLGRMEFQPWWGAWRWPLLTILSGAAFLVFIAGWHLQGAAYAVWVWIFSFYADRSAPVKVCRRLAMAALSPSAVILGAAIFLYGFHRLNLVGLLCAVAAHFAVGWVYLFIAPFWLPRPSGAVAHRRNPFRR
jgi:hypothetical protein